MKIFSNLNARIKAYREEHMGEDGFSLLELVVAVGVLLALSVGGFLAYSGITENAKASAVESAAASVFSAAAAYDADGDSSTLVENAATEYNGSSKQIQVTATGGDGSPIVVQAWDTDGETTPGTFKFASYADRDTDNPKLTAERTSN